MESSSYLGKRGLVNNGAETAPAAFLPAAALGYEYADAAAADARVAAGEMDFFKKEKRERNEAAAAAANAAFAAFVPSSSDDHGIKEDDLTIKVRT